MYLKPSRAISSHLDLSGVCFFLPAPSGNQPLVAPACRAKGKRRCPLRKNPYLSAIFRCISWLPPGPRREPFLHFFCTIFCTFHLWFCCKSTTYNQKLHHRDLRSAGFQAAVSLTFQSAERGKCHSVAV